MDFTKDIKQKELIFFMTPLIFSAAFQQLYTLINTSVVSHYQSYEAVAVIGACTALSSLFNFAVGGMTSGFGFYIGNCIGAQEAEKVQKGFWGAVYLAGFILILGAVLSVCIKPLMGFAKIPVELQSRAAVYSCMIFLGGAWVGLKNILFATIQNLGNVKFPAMISVAGTVTNTLIMVFLVAVLRLDVYASALALMLNNVLICIAMSGYLWINHRELIGIRSLRQIGKDTWMLLLENGFGKSIMMMLISIGATFMQRSVNTLSVEMIAADTYAENTLNIWVQLLAAFGTAAMIITAQNSEDIKSRVYRKTMKMLIVHSLIFSAAGIVFGYLVMPYAVRFIAGSEVKPVVHEAAVLWFRIASIGFLGLTFLLIGRNALQTMGYWKIMPVLGALCMAWNIICSIFVPTYGIKIIAVSFILKWSTPGFFAYLLLRKSVGVRQ